MSIEDLGERAAKRYAEAFGVLSKNVIATTVGESLKPQIMEALKAEMGELKEKKEEKKEEKAVFSSNPNDAPAFVMEVEDWRSIWGRWEWYTAYVPVCIRLEQSDGQLNAVGARYSVRYKQFTRMTEKVQKAFPNEKLPDMPEDTPLGTVCCCCSRNSDGSASRYALSEYCHTISKKFPEAEQPSAHWLLGAQHDQQQIDRQCFMTAFDKTKDSVLSGYAWAWELEPFDEEEAVTELLRHITVHDFGKEISDLSTNSVLFLLLLCITSKWDAAYWKILLAAVDTTVSKSWPAVQAALNQARQKVNDKVQGGSAQLVQSLRPVLGKVAKLVASKMGGGAQEEKAEDKKSDALGDYCRVFQMQRTKLGKTLNDALPTQKDSRIPINAFNDEAKQAIKAAIAEKVESGMKAAAGE